MDIHHCSCVTDSFEPRGVKRVYVHGSCTTNECDIGSKTWIDRVVKINQDLLYVLCSIIGWRTKSAKGREEVLILELILQVRRVP